MGETTLLAARPAVKMKSGTRCLRYAETSRNRFSAFAAGAWPGAGCAPCPDPLDRLRAVAPAWPGGGEWCATLGPGVSSGCSFPSRADLPVVGAAAPRDRGALSLGTV